MLDVLYSEIWWYEYYFPIVSSHVSAIVWLLWPNYAFYTNGVDKSPKVVFMYIFMLITYFFLEWKVSDEIIGTNLQSVIIMLHV